MKCRNSGLTMVAAVLLLLGGCAANITGKVSYRDLENKPLKDAKVEGLVVNMINTTSSPFPGATCNEPINAGEFHYVLEAAVKALKRWVSGAATPPEAPRMQVTSGPTPTFVVDGNGNVLGGIRTPAVDVPVATLSGLGQTSGGGSGSQFCTLFGTTTPFSAAKLATLYPSHRSFVKAWTTDTRSDVSAGFMLRPDGRALIAAASASSVGN